MVVGLVVLTLVVLLILFYVFRELTRTMREASQRVNFVNQVSHELKTPLTNIRMYAELLQQDLEENESAHNRLNVVVEETQRLSRLIGNVLGFARGQRKALTLRPETGILDRCVEEVLNSFLPNMKQLGIHVETDLNAPGLFSFDPDAVAQIIGNLLNNVEKYAADGGYLRVTTRTEGDSVLLDVCDQGPGIPGRMKQRIFKPFFRIHSDLTEGVSGTGIGLSISRDLARLHGGELTLEPSERGSCFRLRLPGAQS
jgi:signal transduction histidine kinase